MRSIRHTLALLALAGIAAATGAQAATDFPAAPMRQAGRLTCIVEPGVGVLFGSTRATRCQFVSNRGGFVQAYAGRIDRLGLDLGVMSGRTLSWRVITPGGASRSGMLDGFFANPSAEATLIGALGGRIDLVVGGDRVVLERANYPVEDQVGFVLGESRMVIGAAGPATVR